MSVGSLESNEKGSGARFNDGKPPVEYIPVRLLAQQFDGSRTARPLRALADFQETRRSGALLDAFYGTAAIPSVDAGVDATHWLIEQEARVFAFGAKKYAAWNWAKGMPWSVPLACAVRHLLALERGEALDSQSGLPHEGHVACNIRMLQLYTRTYPEGDDLPPPGLFRCDDDDGDPVTVAGVSIPAQDLA